MRRIRRLATPRNRRRAAWAFLVLLACAWGATAFLPWRVLVIITFHLSWAALVLTQVGVLATTDVREKEEES